MATFPLDLDVDDDEQVAPAPARPATITSSAPRSRSTIGTGRRETRASDRLARGRGWGWEELRDYVMRSIGSTTGAHVTRDPKIEYGIFNGFIGRHGSARAEKIARWAFETNPEPGMWMNAPIRPTRFTKGSDAVFADVIASRL